MFLYTLLGVSDRFFPLFICCILHPLPFSCILKRASEVLHLMGYQLTFMPPYHARKDVYQHCSVVVPGLRKTASFDSCCCRASSLSTSCSVETERSAAPWKGTGLVCFETARHVVSSPHPVCDGCFLSTHKWSNAMMKSMVKITPIGLCWRSHREGWETFGVHLRGLLSAGPCEGEVVPGFID